MKLDDELRADGWTTFADLEIGTMFHIGFWDQETLVKCDAARCWVPNGLYPQAPIREPFSLPTDQAVKPLGKSVCALPS